MSIQLLSSRRIPAIACYYNILSLSSHTKFVLVFATYSMIFLFSKTEPNSIYLYFLPLSSSAHPLIRSKLAPLLCISLSILLFTPHSSASSYYHCKLSLLNMSSLTIHPSTILPPLSLATLVFLL